MNECEICNKMLVSNISINTVFTTKRQMICKTCYSQLEKVKEGCSMCGKKTVQEICDDCKYWKDKCKDIKNYSLFYYNAFSKEIINKIKFSGDCRVLNLFADELRTFVSKHITKDYQLVPVPLHASRLQERGFNQSLYICQLINYKINDVLVKLNNEKQSKKNRQERLSLNNFVLKSNIDVNDKKLLIVDDIYTTGATVHNIGKVLYEHQAKEVKSLTLFRS